MPKLQSDNVLSSWTYTTWLAVESHITNKTAVFQHTYATLKIVNDIIAKVVLKDVICL